MQAPLGYSIKLATADHVPLLGAIEIAAAGIFPPDSIPDHIRSDSVPVDILLEAVQDGLLWVALAEDGRPVGYALVQLIEDAALLAQMDVHPDHMRKGIGSALIMRAVEQLRLREKNCPLSDHLCSCAMECTILCKTGFCGADQRGCTSIPQGYS